MSDNITKRVGLGTAYGFAKAGGYEGTVAEFTELLGNIAIDLARIENLSVTVTTLPAGSQATASLNGSVLSLGIPKGDKGDKGNTGETGAPAGFGTVSATVDDTIGTPSVEVTASGADTAKNFAFAFHNLKGQKGDKGDTGEVSEAELTQAFEDFSANGTVANAEQLTTDIRANDQTPYLFRTAGGSVDIGDREYINGIVGGTVAWNQLADPTYMHASGTESDVVFTKDGGKLTISGTASANIYARVCGQYTPTSGHKMLFIGAPSEIANVTFYDDSAVRQFDGKTTYALINASGVKIDFKMRILSGSSVNGTVIPQLFDLTQMFGSTIADYIYSLEQATAGAGVAFFKTLFPKPYYAYNAGELKSVSGLISHDMTGFNQWDEVSESGYYDVADGQPASGSNWQRCKNAIPCLPNTTYHYSNSGTGSFGRLLYYDANDNYIGNEDTVSENYTTPSNAHFIRFYASKNQTNICINLAWDNSRNGEYEPYVKHSYPLDSDLELRGNFKLDANNNLYADGDVYPPSGQVQRRYKKTTFNGTEAGWTKEDAIWNSNGLNVFYITLANADIATYDRASAQPHLLCDKFLPVSVTEAKAANTYGFITITGSVNNGKYFEIVHNSSDETAFKAWLASNNVTVVYELATPTTESADPYTSPQIVNDFGTEEFVISNTVAVPIPVGNNTDYPINLKAKVEMAPNSPDGDGDYIVRQTNGTNEYVSIANNATIQNILARLEALEG